MHAIQQGRLVILSGPSCVGKSPLRRALARLCPGLWDRLHALVLFNSRAPRPGEREGVDYYFRSRNEIEALKTSGHHVVLDVRGDLQAVDVEELQKVAERGDAFFEGNPFVGRLLDTHPMLANLERLSIFMSPLSKEEIEFLRGPTSHLSLPEFVTDVMRRKLLRRTKAHKGELSLRDLENVETRARSAYRELTEAWHFQHVIPNHDGEDSDNWDAFPSPIGDARKSLLAIVALLGGHVPRAAERWEQDLLPPEEAS
jgi:guanylate kinase